MSENYKRYFKIRETGSSQVYADNICVYIKEFTVGLTYNILPLTFQRVEMREQ